MKKIFLALAISLVCFLPNISNARVTIGQPLMCQDYGSTNPADADPDATRFTLCSEIIAGSGPGVPTYTRVVGDLATQLQDVLTLTSSITGVALTNHGGVTISGTFGYSAGTSSFLPIPYVFPTDAIPRLTAGLSVFPMTQFLTGSDNWRSWRGALMSSTDVIAATAAPWTGSILWGQGNAGTFNKLRILEHPLSFDRGDYQGVLAHEIMHAKINNLGFEFDKIIENYSSGFDKYIKYDGVTAYSTKWWKDYAITVGYRQAVNETLSEIGRLDREGKIDTVNDFWVKLYKIIKDK